MRFSRLIILLCPVPDPDRPPAPPASRLHALTAEDLLYEAANVAALPRSAVGTGALAAASPPPQFAGLISPSFFSAATPAAGAGHGNAHAHGNRNGIVSSPIPLPPGGGAYAGDAIVGTTWGPAGVAASLSSGSGSSALDPSVAANGNANGSSVPNASVAHLLPAHLHLSAAQSAAVHWGASHAEQRINTLMFADAQTATQARPDGWSEMRCEGSHSHQQIMATNKSRIRSSRLVFPCSRINKIQLDFEQCVNHVCKKLANTLSHYLYFDAHDSLSLPSATLADRRRCNRQWRCSNNARPRRPLRSESCRRPVGTPRRRRRKRTPSGRGPSRIA
jgi:hypothetical protein